MNSTGAAEPARTFSYGTAPEQVADLHLPIGEGPWPVVVVIHGGFWRARYDRSLGTPLAADLASRGYAAWNIEYRRVGNGGGWPLTLTDVAAATDRLADLDAPLRLDQVISLGHSAGGHLAAWLAGRDRLPAPFGPPRVRIAGVVSQAGVVDLEAAAAARLGNGAVDDFAGGRMGPADWRIASPRRLLPLGVGIRCVHGADDDSVPPAQSSDFVAAARAEGDDAELITVPGDHFGVVTPGEPGWAACLRAIAELVALIRGE